MKNILVIMSLLIPLLFVSCSSPDDTTPVTSVSGTWNSFHIFDGDENDIDGVEMRLVLQQKYNEISGVLNIIENNITVQTVDVKGTMTDTSFTLDGKSETDTYMLYGFLEDAHSMQITQNKNYNTSNANDLKVSHALLTLEDSTISLPPTNKYEIKCKCNCETRSDDNIILIHGLNSEAKIWDNMVKHFKKGSICNDFTVWTYQYDWKEHIEKSSQDMIARVNYAVGDEDPILIAHSMGGLVARSYIANYGYYKRLITLGTPHLGAILGATLFYAYDGIKDLSPLSSFIRTLYKNEFEQTQRSNYFLINGRIGYEWECAKTCTTFGKDWCCWKKRVGKGGNYPWLLDRGYSLLPKPNDGMVSEISSRFEGDTNGVQRAPEDKFEWICHDWLPFKEPVIKYVEQNLLDNR